MNNKILLKAQMKIDEKRQYADEVAIKNLQKALLNPEFKDLYVKQKELEIEIARCQAYGENYDKSTLDEILTKQEFLLKSMGLNGTDLLPNHECVLCNDTGYVQGAPCECLKREINKELLAESGFSGRLNTFEDEHIDSPVFDLMQKWCDTKSDKYNVLISGLTGTGKTYLTECIASKLMSKGKVVLFTTAFNMNNSMLNYHISFDSNREEIINPYLSCEVLIIDDLGTEPMLKNVTKEYLYLIINERMLNHLSTIITTNLNLEDIMNIYGERIFSRLVHKQSSLCLRLDGEDLRLKK